jgi:hypothetical protein
MQRYLQSSIRLQSKLLIKHRDNFTFTGVPTRNVQLQNFSADTDEICFG